MQDLVRKGEDGDTTVGSIEGWAREVRAKDPDKPDDDGDSRNCA